MDRALRANIIAKSGKAVEVAGDVDTLLLDKRAPSPSATAGRRSFCRSANTLPAEVGHLAALASAADQTPEGKSIVELYRKQPGSNRWPAILLRERASSSSPPRHAMSGIDLPDGRVIRKGASDAVIRHVQAQNGTLPNRLREQVDNVASQGATPLLVCEGNRIAGWSCWKTF